jgi:hypothetical protein
MNQYAPLEERLESLGAALRERPRLTDRVMNEVRESSAGLSEASSTLARIAPRATTLSRRSLFAVVGVGAAIGAGLLMAITLFSPLSVGWAEVTKAIQSQNWIRGTVDYSDGRRGTMWLSPARQIWAYGSNDSFYFFDGPQQARYEYRGGNEAITKLPLGEDDAERVLSIGALSQDKDVIGPWLFGTEKIVHQKRQEVTDNGKTWIEFQLVLWRGDFNQATLRVDPATRLPVYLLLASPTEKAKSIKWVFDYPDVGPSDIYALGVPREIEVDNRMPVADAQRVLAAMSASRAGIGDFRLIVGISGRPASVVRRKANRWRVDLCWPPIAVASGVAPEAPHDRNWGEWFEEQLKLNEPIPLFVCDGKTVWKNSNIRPGERPQWQSSSHLAPQDLLSGDGLGGLDSAPYTKFASLMFPDLYRKQGWGFEFEPQPADAPGCVLLKRSARLATAEPQVGHEWYYIDPAKGYAVVRAELFNLPADTPADPQVSLIRQKIRLEGFQQSPHGLWYPTVVSDITPSQGANQPLTTEIRYHFDFNADLPDSLFAVESEPSKQP